MNAPADLMKLAELRFFRDLIDAERMKVFKAFDLLPQDHDEQIPHAIQRKLFEQIASTRQAASVGAEVAGEADIANSIREYFKSIGSSAVVSSDGIERVYYSGFSLIKLTKAIALALASPSRSEGVRASEVQSESLYRDAIDQALVVRHLGVAKGDAVKELDTILSWEVAVALDPRVSEAAQALIDQGAGTVAQAAPDSVLTPKHFLDDILSACDASNWDADRNTGDYFKGLRDAYEVILEIAGEYQTSIYAWSKASLLPSADRGGE